MHSRIYQVGLNPISKEDWSSPEDFYENSGDFADYIGDRYEGNDREDYIKGLAGALSDIFYLDGDSLVFKGIGNFIKEWHGYIKELASKLGTTYDDMALWHIRKATERTHKDVYSRFVIEDWNSYAEPYAELVEYVVNHMKKGDRLYIGAVIDYHF